MPLTNHNFDKESEEIVKEINKSKKTWKILIRLLFLLSTNVSLVKET